MVFLQIFQLIRRVLIPHQIDLKVKQLPRGRLSQVKGFVVGPEDVVQVKQGENISASTSPDLQIHKVTVTNVQGIPVDLAPLPNNVWSLQGLSPGAYTLDVSAAMSSSGFLGTYETMLAILEPNQQPMPPASIISQITVEESAECPLNLILVNGNCVEPSTPTMQLSSKEIVSRKVEGYICLTRFCRSIAFSATRSISRV
jgi:hypothetical protein